MAIKFFGNYLLDKGKLTPEQLTEAVEYQSLKNLSLGEIAVREQLITLKDAETINDKQRVLDKRFGEVSVSLGILTEEQIEILLKLQKKEKIFFGEVIVEKNFISQELLSQELQAFEKEQKLESIALNEEIDTLDKDHVIKNSIAIFQKLYSRIVHDYIKLVAINHQNTNPQGVIVLQKMRGDLHLDFALQAENAVSLEISQKFLKMEFDTIDEMVLDIISEFVNVILGNIAVKLSANSVKVDLTPPNILRKEEFKNSEYISFDFATTHGSLTLHLKL
jgi:CheY-specific phosphatase CheX